MSNIPSNITIRKLNHEGRETWHYTGVVLERTATCVQLEAFFNRDDSDAGYVVFRRGDRFIEWFYSDRWYNIFQIHDVRDKQVKGWYCNLTRPAVLEADTISSEDLALDMWIDPAGKILMLDEDEFADLPIDASTRQQVLQAAEDLRRRVVRHEHPFDIIP
jgi:uncharacterized protein